MSTPQFQPVNNWTTSTPASGPLWQQEFDKLYGTMYQYWQDCAKVAIGEIIFTTSQELQGNMAQDFVLGEAQLLNAVDYPILASMLAKKGSAGYIYDNQVYKETQDPSHNLDFPDSQVPAGQFRLPWLQGMTPVMANLGSGSGANKGFYQNWQPGIYGDIARNVKGNFGAGNGGTFSGPFSRSDPQGWQAKQGGGGDPRGYAQGAFDLSRAVPTGAHASPPCTILFGYIRIQYTVQGVGTFK